MFRKMMAFGGFVFDCMVLVAAMIVVYNVYVASEQQPPVTCPAPPQVDWSEAWELWRGDTGDLPNGETPPEKRIPRPPYLYEPIYRVPNEAPKRLPPVEQPRTPPSRPMRPDRVC